MAFGIKSHKLTAPGCPSKVLPVAKVGVCVCVCKIYIGLDMEIQQEGL